MSVTSRQFATGLAAFFVTVALLLANAPVERSEDGLQFERGSVAAQVRTVLTRIG